MAYVESCPFALPCPASNTVQKFNEGDASATRLDFYLNNGDNIVFVPELFKQMHQRALAKGNGTYSVDAIKEHFKNRYHDSRAANSQFYFNLVCNPARLTYLITYLDLLY
jgi:hypothetical protein